MKHAAASIDVTAIGLVSSVGHDAVTACAAIRAGISRPAEIDGTKALDLGSAKSVPMTGHPIAPFTNGFSGTARWLQIAPRAFDDLVRSVRMPPPDDAGFWSSTAVMLLVADLEERRFVHDPRSDPGAITASFVGPLRRRLPATLPARNVLIQPVDRIGLALVVDGFRELTEDMKVERVIVLAVDSYLCPFALDWLGEAGRLKSDLNPVGLVPGEAAAALLLERSLRGAHPDRPALARIIAVATAQDAHFEEEDARPRGRALADVLRPLLTDETGDLYLDLNGEEWRAKEYGHALVELAPRALGPARLHHPAAEIGDTGSAAFVVSTILAARSLQRGYAGGPQVAVATSVETGEIGGLLLRRVEGG
jgi:3-oxoacyl-[acyl-carrier-protein] synthase I